MPPDPPHSPFSPPRTAEEPLERLTLHISPDLYRAYQRCTWMIIHETGRSQLEIMQETIRDFLIKNGC